jgi:hypothetical protein
VRSAGFVVIALVAACDFTKNAGGPDGKMDGSDGPPDVPLGSFTTDAISHIATPLTTAEWQAFLAQKGLSSAIMPPNGLWLMGEPAGQLNDTIGSAALAVNGTPMYQFHESGWQRVGVKTADNQNNDFSNNTDGSLPNLAQASMTVLLYYASTATPGGLRTVLIAGSGNPSNFGELTIDQNGKLSLITNNVAATTTSAYDGGLVTPIVVKLDRAHTAQTLYTKTEMVSVSPYQNLMSNPGGIFIGGGHNSPPPGVWLYMAAWYGHPAELTDMQVNQLITALGF